jgi:transposase
MTTTLKNTEGAKRDNNEMEAQLKLKIRDRKNAMFYKTLHGASIADIVTSVIATVTKTNANVFDYFNVVQQEQGKVKANPQNYLPWNYTENR